MEGFKTRFIIPVYQYNYDFVISTTICQRELWTDNIEIQKEEKLYQFISETELSMMAEVPVSYGEKK